MSNLFSQTQRQCVSRAVADRRGMTLVEVMMATCVFALVFGSVITALRLANYRAFWATCDLEAGKQAEQQMEQMQAAQWDITASPTIDEVVSNNFTNTTSVLLAYTNNAPPVISTNWVTIATLPNTANPLYKVMTSSVAWMFEGKGPYTNSLTTIRALDQ